MATNFPTSLDALTNPTSTDALTSPSHADQHANSNDAIEALQAKVGVNSSAVTTSLDYKVTNGLVPVGVVSAYAGSSAPSGWLLCFGQAVSRSTYSTLFTALSTTYGAGDGSTTFNLPDLRGRLAAGLDNMGGTAASRLTSTVLSASNTLGATGGTQTHTITSAQLPAHSHPNTLGSNTVASDGHTHSARGTLAAAIGASGADANTIAYDAGSVVSGGPTNATVYTVFGSSHTTASRAFNHYTAVYGVTAGNSGSTTVSITNANNTGGGSAHTITQPTLVLNYIIKAL